MIFGWWSQHDFGYEVLLLLHITAAIVGFGSSFVWPVLAAKARKLDPPTAFAVNKAGSEISKPLTTYMIYATTIIGLVMVVVGNPWKFTQTWVLLAIVVTAVAIVIAEFLHTPNLKAMLALQEKLASGQVTPSPGGPPAEVAELQERGKRAGMYGGILHLLFLVLMIDMIWKPWL